MLILLDIDGTLVDTNYLHVDAWARALGKLGVDVPRAEIHRQIGKGADQLLPFFGVKEKDHEKAGKLRLKYYAKIEKRAGPLPGARELVPALKKDGHQVWLATSGEPEEVKARLKVLGLKEKAFDGIVNAGDVKRSKPHPDIFSKAIERAKARPKDTVVVGDTRWDMEAARSAGARAIGLLTGGAFSEQQLKDAGAFAVFADCAELKAKGLQLLRTTGS